METTNLLPEGVIALTDKDLLLLNGGRFAYDLAFFLREIVIDAVNGGGLPGMSAVIADISLNYKPVN